MKGGLGREEWFREEVVQGGLCGGFGGGTVWGGCLGGLFGRIV